MMKFLWEFLPIFSMLGHAPLLIYLLFSNHSIIYGFFYSKWMEHSILLCLTLDLPIFSMLGHAPLLTYLPMFYTYRAFRKYKQYWFQLKTLETSFCSLHKNPILTITFFWNGPYEISPSLSERGQKDRVGIKFSAKSVK